MRSDAIDKMDKIEKIRKGKPRDIKSYYGLPKRGHYDDLMAGDCAVRSRICSAS